MRSTFFGFGCTVLLLALSGCGDDEEHSPHDNLSEDCDAIAEACHEFDTATGEAHDCHVLAEENNAGVCTENLERCTNACQE